MYKRAAAQVAKILKGNQPANIPIEQAMKFELFINLKTPKPDRPWCLGWSTLILREPAVGDIKEMYLIHR
jgi:ABC transporter substrate binding protein